ncbi:uncharacterized protein MELLADRAFT_105107 [Melampsora larici-populina 98AG31]|uniref:Alpha-type protein kinase domain-containing protein n=1 Tax=Melampsora larici-populina (strain 98AG31 / pathotype 3-4-7) TaxID=747676 RepID=F4RHF5_MELLP|nr:uncharacterized protein MELLADRAFT_105107 [Melampsora larici-populina 98AG31]EGG08365.1 hypothetical protein MELLADRAFT_105107 [Melampsora larici-populina 98AG31]
MDLYQMIGFGTYQLDLSASEQLGWRSLPFDQPVDEDDNLTGLAFGLIPSGAQAHNPADVLSYNWAFRPVDVCVIKKALWCWDGRVTYPAVLRRGSEEIKLQACALQQREDILGDHLRLAQMYAHAERLLERFKVFVLLNARLTIGQQEDLHKLRIVKNIVVREGKSRDRPDDSNVPRWYSLREPVDRPEYLTSDSLFAPKYRAGGDLASIAALLVCFTHWSYEYHQRHALITGFRGSAGVITDLTMEDNERPWFLGNPSTAGLQLFTATHICDSVWCHGVGFKRPPPYYAME